MAASTSPAPTPSTTGAAIPDRRVLLGDRGPCEARRHTSSQNPKPAIAANAAKWAKRREAINEADFNDAEALRKKVQEIIAMPVVRRTLTQTEISEDGRTIINNYTIEPLAVRAADAARMLQLASDRQRLAADMATQIVETVTPESQSSARLAEARRALEEGLQRFPELPPEQMAADLAALYSDDRKGIAIAPEDLLQQELDVTTSDRIQ